MEAANKNLSPAILSFPPAILAGILGQCSVTQQRMERSTTMHQQHEQSPRKCKSFKWFCVGSPPLPV